MEGVALPFGQSNGIETPLPFDQQNGEGGSPSFGQLIEREIPLLFDLPSGEEVSLPFRYVRKKLDFACSLSV